MTTTTKIVSSLTGTVTEGPAEPGRHRALVHLEVTPGNFLNVALAADGLRVFRGDPAAERVFIPMAEILQLAAAATERPAPASPQE